MWIATFRVVVLIRFKIMTIAIGNIFLKMAIHTFFCDFTSVFIFAEFLTLSRKVFPDCNSVHQK